jgi:ectoine hydroxylase-related dioxygenase (phytanoyl-CoA dioxygenase family)
MMFPRYQATATDWLQPTLNAVRSIGYAVVERVLDGDVLSRTRDAMYRCRAAILTDIGEDRLARAGELGVLRLMMKYEPVFFEFLRLRQLLAVVDAIVSPTAILHLQNGFILPSASAQNSAGRGRFQSTYHQDFPRVLNGYVASVNVFFSIDDFTSVNGATWVIPGTHQRAIPPADETRDANAVCVECPAGSMIVFDSTLWHAAGRNVSGGDRLAINHQFTRSFFKQQIDYVRALGDRVIVSLDPRTQQLLGWYTRVVTSLDEYYRPAEERLYRSGQG